MAVQESQPTVSLIAETTFAKTDIGKFLSISTANGRVSVVASTGVTHVVGVLLSDTYSTSTGANEAVTVGLLQGVGPVYMAGSTIAAGGPVAPSSLGFGTAPSTNITAIGYVIDGSSGTTGRLHSVLFAPSHNV